MMAKTKSGSWLLIGSIILSVICATRAANSPSQRPKMPKINVAKTSDKENSRNDIKNCLRLVTEIRCNDRGFNEIPKIPKTFGDLKSITKFNMTNNSVRKLDLAALPPVDNLEILDFSNNSIDQIIIPSNINSMNNLTELRLSLNMLQTIDALSRLQLKSLTSLYLDNNRIEYIDKDTFSNWPNIATLILRSNPIHNIYPQAFDGLARLRSLDLSSCKPANGQLELDEYLFSNNMALDELNLSDLGLLEVPSAIRHTRNLTNLILSANNMSSLRETDFLNSNQLVSLQIDRCPLLRYVQEYTFGAMQNLSTLSMSRNAQLKTISPDCFRPDPNSNNQIEPHMYLEMLDLSYNNLSTLLPFPMVTIKFINLTANSWNCDGDLKWLQIRTIGTTSLIHCAQPDNYRNMEIHEISLPDFQDNDSRSNDCIIITIVLLILFGIIIAFLIQKSEFCRRFLWRDQYGTIYYTKASFPQEAT